MPLLGPKQRMDDLKQALLNSNYSANSLLKSCGVSKLMCAIKLEKWAAVNFSSTCDMRMVCQDLVRCGETIGYVCSDFLWLELYMFLFKRKTGAGEREEAETTVGDYFVRHRDIQLHKSRDFPCIDVGKQNHPIYILTELCCLVPFIVVRNRCPVIDNY